MRTRVIAVDFKKLDEEKHAFEKTFEDAMPNVDVFTKTGDKIIALKILETDYGIASVSVDFENSITTYNCIIEIDDSKRKSFLEKGWSEHIWKPAKIVL